MKKLIAIAAIAFLTACDRPPITHTATVGPTSTGVQGLPNRWGTYRALNVCLNGVKYYLVEVRDGFTLTPVYSRSLTQPTLVNSAPDAC
jgi:hypothetical protein